MKYRFELLPCPMQENDRLAERFMRRAQEGWKLRHMWRNLMIYRKDVPATRQLRVDCLDRSHAFTLTDSDNALNYDAFLCEYGCRRWCGYGYRQVIEVPDAAFLLRDGEEQRQLEQLCDLKECRFRWIIRIVLAAACLLTALIQYRFDFYAPLYSLLWMAGSLLLIFLLTSGRWVYRLHDLRARAFMLCALRALILCLFAALAWENDAWSTALLGSVALLALFLLQQPALKRGWFTRKTLHVLSVALMLGIGSVMFIRIFPLPTASAQEREAFYIENRVIEDLPVRYESPFSDGEVLSHRRIERALGKGTEYSYACKETQQLFHVEAYENPDQLTLPEAFAQADLGDMHDPHFATHLSIGGREAWLLHEDIGFHMEGTTFYTYTLAFADDGQIVLASLPGFSYDEEQARAFMDSLQ